MNIQMENFLNTTREGELHTIENVEIVFQKGMSNAKLKTHSMIVIVRAGDTWVSGSYETSTGKLVEIWYKGENWDEMLTAFRKSIAQKMKLGFIPVDQTPNMFG